MPRKLSTPSARVPRTAPLSVRTTSASPWCPPVDAAAPDGTARTPAKTPARTTPGTLTPARLLITLSSRGGSVNPSNTIVFDRVAHARKSRCGALAVLLPLGRHAGVENPDVGQLVDLLLGPARRVDDDQAKRLPGRVERRVQRVGRDVDGVAGLDGERRGVLADGLHALPRDHV